MTKPRDLAPNIGESGGRTDPIMPRLRIDDEPPQHGKATGSYVDNAALKARRSTPQKRASPQTAIGGARKKPRHPSPRSQAVIATEAVAARMLPAKAGKRKFAAIATEHGVGPEYPQKAANKVLKTKALPAAAGRKRAGRPPRITAEVEQELRSTLEEHAYELTFEQIEEITGIPKSTVQRFMAKHKWRQVAKGTRPCLAPDNVAGRLKWAQDNEKNEWRCHVDLDEKWFYALSRRVKLKLPPGVKAPKARIKSKRYVPKVMLRPDPTHNFDGLVGIWRCCKQRPAKRGDSRTGLKKGDTITEDINMDGPTFERMLRKDVIPAIREKMAWASVVNLQFDNAPGHKTRGKKGDANSSIASRLADVLKAPTGGRGRRTGSEVKLFGQEPNSPCTNTNDLGFYNSMDSRLPKQRSFKLDELAQQCIDSFWEYPSEKLDALFETKMVVCSSIIAAGGDNDFKLPHKK